MISPFSAVLLLAQNATSLKIVIIRVHLNNIAGIRCSWGTQKQARLKFKIYRQFTNRRGTVARGDGKRINRRVRLTM